MKFSTTSAATSSLPKRTFVAISHAEAALTQTVFCLLRKRFWADTGSEGLFISHQSRACVSSRRRMPLLPTFQFFRREAFEEFGTNMNFALQGAGLAIATGLSDLDETTDSFPRAITISSPRQAFLMRRANCGFAF